MLRRFASLLLAPLLASCQPPEILVRAGFLGNALAFVAADSGDSDSSFCWREATVVDDRLSPAWGFAGPNTGECRGPLPLFYGRPPDGASTTVEAARLEPGRLYLFIGDATAGISGAFALTRAGRIWIVHNVDPDSPTASALRQRWWERRASEAANAPPPGAEGAR